MNDMTPGFPLLGFICMDARLGKFNIEEVEHFKDCARSVKAYPLWIIVQLVWLQVSSHVQHVQFYHFLTNVQLLLLIHQAVR